jgi:hypothetical protein
VRFFYALLGLVLLVGSIVLLVVGLIEEPTLATPLATVVAAVLAVVAGQAYSRSQETKAAHREELLPLYASFMLAIHGSTRREAAEEVGEAIEELEPALWLRGPAPVIQAYNDWDRQLALIGDADDIAPEHWVALEKLMRAIRADLGLNDSDLPMGELLRVAMRDAEEVVAPR